MITNNLTLLQFKLWRTSLRTENINLDYFKNDYNEILLNIFKESIADKTETLESIKQIANFAERLTGTLIELDETITNVSVKSPYDFDQYLYVRNVINQHTQIFEETERFKYFFETKIEGLKTYNSEIANRYINFWVDCFAVHKWKKQYGIDLNNRPFFTNTIRPWLEYIQGGKRVITLSPIIATKESFMGIINNDIMLSLNLPSFYKDHLIFDDVIKTYVTSKVHIKINLHKERINTDTSIEALVEANIIAIINNHLRQNNYDEDLIYVDEVNSLNLPITLEVLRSKKDDKIINTTSSTTTQNEGDIKKESIISDILHKTEDVETIKLKEKIRNTQSNEDNETSQIIDKKIIELKTETNTEGINEIYTLDTTNNHLFINNYEKDLVIDKEVNNLNLPLTLINLSTESNNHISINTHSLNNQNYEIITNLIEYGFFELNKIKDISKQNPSRVEKIISKLLDSRSKGEIIFPLAIYNELGFITKLLDSNSLNETKMLKTLALLLGKNEPTETRKTWKAYNCNSENIKYIYHYEKIQKTNCKNEIFAFLWGEL